MTKPKLRRFLLGGAASLSVIPTVLGLQILHAPATTRVAEAPTRVTPTTAVEPTIEATLTPVTTTTIAPPPTTAVTAPPTTRVTSPPTTRVTAPRVVAASATVEERGAAALALINFPWQQLGYRVDFVGGRVGVLGETNSTLHTITIYVRDGQTPQQLARTIAHEMGHALDFSFTTIAEARQYLAIRNLPYDVKDWYPTCDGCTDFGSPAGDFAETFAYYLFGPGDFRSLIGSEPTAEQLAQLTAIFSPS
jgi:hypothetical protein